MLSQEPERRPDASVPHPHPTDAKVSCSRTPEDPLRPEAPSPTSLAFLSLTVFDLLSTDQNETFYNQQNLKLSSFSLY